MYSKMYYNNYYVLLNVLYNLHAIQLHVQEYITVTQKILLYISSKFPLVQKAQQSKHELIISYQSIAIIHYKHYTAHTNITCHDYQSFEHIQQRER